MRTFLLVACIAALAGGLVPATGRAAEPTTFGRTTGTIECRSYQYETSNGNKRNTPTMPCDRAWSVDVVNAPQWTFEDSRRFDGRAANGISYVQTISESASYDMTLAADGKLTEMELRADLATTVSHAGNTKVVLDLDIPFIADADVLRVQDTLNVVAGGGGNYLAFGEVEVSVECSDGEGGTDSLGNRLLKQRARDFPTRNQGTPDLDAALRTGDGSCVLRVKAEVRAQNSAIIKSDHLANAEAHLEVKLSAEPCDLGGVVRDGNEALDQHANPMPGIKVELYDQDDDPTGIKDVTDRDGEYCLHDVPEEDFTLRAALADDAHEPSMFRTMHGTAVLPEAVSVDVVAGDLGRDDFDVEFASEDERPWLADVANIHWQSTRFVYWLLASGVATAEELGAFTMRTGASNGTSYSSRDLEAYINEADTPFSQRRGFSAECPENCEWHEIVHHVGSALGIAPTGSQLCVGRVRAHGGWRNGSTCDSVGEGFATYLSTLGSLTIDAGHGPEGGTPDYSVFGSLEDDGSRPWQLYTGGSGEVFGREDLAVSELLWDLSDDTPQEVATIAIVDPLKSVGTPDVVSLDGVGLVRLMSQAGVMTVADLYRALVGSDQVPEDLRQATVVLDNDPAHNVTPIAALFLAHDFHPVHDLTVPWYTLGDPIAVTNRQPVSSTTGRPEGSPAIGVLAVRDHMDLLPGEAIEFTNGTGAEITYEMDIAYPSTSSHRTVTVAPGARLVVPVVLPPYWRGFAEPGVLPPCDPATGHVVTLTISGGGAKPRTITNCEYWKLMAETTSGVALTFPAVALAPSAGPGSPVASSDPGTTPAADGSGSAVMLVVVAAVLVVVVAVLLLFGARRRRNGGTASGG